MKKITIDMLYDSMRSYVHAEQRRPTHLLIHPAKCKDLDEIEMLQFGYNEVEGKFLSFRGVRIIRTFDIEEDRLIFLS